MSKVKIEKKQLTDAQLVAKYGNDTPVNFEEAVKKMVEGASTTAKNKGRQAANNNPK